jgi:sugar phosphate isomerase/epimerase
MFDTAVDKFPEEARRLNLLIENIHIPFGGEDKLWQDTVDSELAEEKVIECIKDCHNHGIKTAVMHAHGWKSKIPLSDIGVYRYLKIVEAAERYDVNLALENISDTRAIDLLFAKIDSDKLKFCYDNGHDNIFPQEDNLIHKYKNKLLALHLTDNDGKDDQHLLPFDGQVNWSRLIKDLRDISYQGPLSFEVGWQYRDKIKKYSHDEYIKELKKRAIKILSL